MEERTESDQVTCEEIHVSILQMTGVSLAKARD